MDESRLLSRGTFAAETIFRTVGIVLRASICVPSDAWPPRPAPLLPAVLQKNPGMLFCNLNSSEIANNETVHIHISHSYIGYFSNRNGRFINKISSNRSDQFRFILDMSLYLLLILYTNA